MPKKHFDEWIQANPFVQKLPHKKQEILYEELKSHGEVVNPIKYTETHLEGGIEDVLEDEAEDKIPGKTSGKNEL
jgi:hypothetical protein